MKNRLLIKLIFVAMFSLFVMSAQPGLSINATQIGNTGKTNYGARTIASTQYYCGYKSYHAYTSIDFGCEHHGNPIEAILFAIVKWLSDGAGLIVIANIVLAGVQFTTSRDEPQAKAAAQKRIEHSIIALLIYFFAYAILNYLVPNQILK